MTDFSRAQQAGTTRAFTVGLDVQRQLSKDMLFELAYFGIGANAITAQAVAAAEIH